MWDGDEKGRTHVAYDFSFEEFLRPSAKFHEVWVGEGRGVKSMVHSSEIGGKVYVNIDFQKEVSMDTGYS